MKCEGSYIKGCGAYYIYRRVREGGEFSAALYYIFISTIVNYTGVSLMFKKCRGNQGNIVWLAEFSRRFVASHANFSARV